MLPFESRLDENVTSKSDKRVELGSAQLAK